MKKSAWLLLLALPLMARAQAPSQSAATPSGRWEVRDDWASLPAGMKWGVTSAVASNAKDAIFVIRRGVDTGHAASDQDLLQGLRSPILGFENGKLVKQFGQGLFKSPHGLKFDREGFLWAIDYGDHMIYKFDLSQNQKILLTLGTRGVTGEGPNTFNRPSDVAFAPNGDFFITDGYGNARVVKYSKDGTFIKTWGTHGTGPGQFHTPHSVVLDSKNRVIVADRDNARVQVFDLDGKFLELWTHLGKRPGGLAIASDDTLYVSDSDAQTITISKNGKILDVIENLNLGRPHSLTLDSSGAIYMADVTHQRARKIVRTKK